VTSPVAFFLFIAAPLPCHDEAERFSHSIEDVVALGDRPAAESAR
jgi:hypothetical protein